MLFPDFDSAINHARSCLKNSPLVHPQNWQGVDISDKPEMATHEFLHLNFRVPMHSRLHADYQGPIAPNLPWADDHFEERVCGYPINPGVQWAKWPYGHSAQKFLDERGMFNHNYMERYWPKFAGLTPAGTDQEWQEKAIRDHLMERPAAGIRYTYGDADDVARLLAEQPLTRQAYLPIWFPEDTGGGNKRAPCTLGYHFIVRRGKLDITYYIRSCDFVRHFRDDIYLTVRLALWMIERARHFASDDQKEFWATVLPGYFIMHITSLHLFRNDYVQVFGQQAPRET